MTFLEKYNQRVDEVGALLSVGLDSDLTQIPAKFKSTKNPQFEFNKWIIEQTFECTSAYKINTAFYEAGGAKGWEEMALTMKYLRTNHPTIPTIADAKRADIGSTNEAYVKAIFDELGFDAITLHAYVGKEALAPFLQRKDKGCIFLCKTSNPGSGEFQDLGVGDDQQPLWQVVAKQIAEHWNEHGNCLLVVGATYPEHMEQVRKLVGEMTFLVPGVGAQGGDLETVLKVGLNKVSKGLIINSSRGVIFAADPHAEATKLADQMRTILQQRT